MSCSICKEKSDSAGKTKMPRSQKGEARDTQINSHRVELSPNYGTNLQYEPG